MPLVLITTRYLFNVWESFFNLTSWWVTNWAVQRISIVSLFLQDCLHQWSPWSGTTYFRSCHTAFRPKLPPKIGNFEFSWISRRDRIGLSNCLDLHMHYRATVSASNFQVLICSGWWDSTLWSFIRFFGWTSSWSKTCILGGICTIQNPHNFSHRQLRNQIVHRRSWSICPRFDLSGQIRTSLWLSLSRCQGRSCMVQLIDALSEMCEALLASESMSIRSSTSSSKSSLLVLFCLLCSFAYRQAHFFKLFPPL